MITEPNKKCKNLTHLKGILFECLACVILFIKGYKILKRNFKIKTTSQIDILCQKDDLIIIIEVKYRKKFKDAIIAIHPSQKNRLKRSAISLNKNFNKQIRIDSVLFSNDKPFIKHIKNIF